MKTVRYVIYGMLMGIANVIPGVSGGTIAVILNFYDDLIQSITLDFKVLKTKLNFLIPLGVGILSGIVLFSNIVQYFLTNFEMQTCFAFIGIIFGSVPLIYKNATEGGLKKGNLIFFVLALALMIGLFFVSPSEMNTIAYTTLSMESFVVLLLSMAIATVTMILPGISGSLILIIIGMYNTIYGYIIADRIIPLLIPVALGAILGLIGGAKVVDVLLQKAKQATYFAILGLILGSIVNIYPGFSFDFNGVTSIGVAAIFFVIVYWFGKQKN